MGELFAKILAAALLRRAKIAAVAAAIAAVVHPAHAGEPSQFTCRYTGWVSSAVSNSPLVPQAMRTLRMEVYVNEVVLQFPGMDAWKYQKRFLVRGFAFGEANMFSVKDRKLMLGNEYDYRKFDCEEIG